MKKIQCAFSMPFQTILLAILIKGCVLTYFHKKKESASLSSGFPLSFSIQLLTVEENFPLANDLMV